jgi:hypothetical protein
MMRASTRAPGNPQKLSHNAETPDNPHGVWAFKRLPAPAAE